jgi:hypothetical protein
MLLTPTQVSDEFKKYGLIGRLVPLTDDVFKNVDGLIKNVAITLGSEFDFIGEPVDPDGIYPFPRKGIYKGNLSRSGTPDCIYEAQLYILIHDKSESFLPASYNRNKDVTYLDRGSSKSEKVTSVVDSKVISSKETFSDWNRYSIRSFCLHDRVKAMISEYLIPDSAVVSFEVKTKAAQSLLEVL